MRPELAYPGLGLARATEIRNQLVSDVGHDIAAGVLPI